MNAVCGRGSPVLDVGGENLRAGDPQRKRPGQASGSGDQSDKFPDALKKGSPDAGMQPTAKKAPSAGRAGEGS